MVTAVKLSVTMVKGRQWPGQDVEEGFWTDNILYPDLELFVMSFTFWKFIRL